MHYRLRENISYCDVDGHLIFLDIAQDRYFKLTGYLAETMRRFNAHGEVASTPLTDLADAGILAEGPYSKTLPKTENFPRATCSAIEQAVTSANHRLSASLVFEVLVTVWSTRCQLNTLALKTHLDEARTYRDRRTDADDVAAPIAQQRLAQQRLLEANAQFARARRYVPIEPVCLLDSLSLLRFLSRRGLSANIVFGVTPEPFAAHCWAQAGDMVLNDTFFDTHAYTPIRVV